MADDAFISYSLAADARLAQSMHRGLSRFARPWYRRRAMRVWFDDKGLAVNPAIWPSIVRRLDTTEWLVLLASRDAAASEPVNREIEYWVTHRDPERIIAVVTDGVWVWDEGAGDFDWNTSTAVPSALRGALPAEPHHIDLRWARGDTTPETAPRWRPAIAELAATIRGVATDDVETADLRERRRTRRVVGVAVAALAMITLVAVTSAFIGADTTRKTKHARDAANIRRAIAEAHNLRVSDPQLAALLAVEAYHQSETPQTEGAMQAVLLADPRLLGGRTDPTTTTGYRSLCLLDDRTAVTGGADGTITVTDLAGNARRSNRLTVANTAIGCTAGSSGTLVAFSDAGDVWTLDATNVAVEATRRVPGVRVNDVAVSPDGRWIAAGTDAGFAVVWAPDDITPRATLPMGSGATGVAFSPDGATLVLTADDALIAWDTTTWNVREQAPPATPSAHAPLCACNRRYLRFATDGRSIAETRGDAVIMWNVGPLAPRWSRPFPSGTPTAAAFTPDGSRVFIDVTADGIEPLDTATGANAGRTFGSSEAADQAVAVTPDQSTLVAAAFEDPAITLWALDDRSLIRRSVTASGQTPSYSPSGHTMLVLDGDDRSAPATTEVLSTRDGTLVGRGPAALLPVLVDDHTIGAIARDEQAFVRYDAVTGARIGPATPLPGFERSVAATTDASGRVALSYDDGSVKLYGVGDTPVRTLQIGAVATALSLSPDGERLAAATAGGVGVYEVESGEPEFDIIPGATGGWWFTTDDDDDFLVVQQADTRLAFIDLDLDKVVGPTIPADGSDASAQFVAENFIVAGPGGVQLFDTDSRVAIGDPFPTTGVPGLRGDGLELATGRAGGIAMWDLDPQHWQAAACTLAGRNLTVAEWNTYFPNSGAYHATCPEFPRGD